MAPHGALVVSLLMMAGVQADDLADRSRLHAFLSKHKLLGSDASQDFLGDYDKFITPNVKNVKHGGGPDALAHHNNLAEHGPASEASQHLDVNGGMGASALGRLFDPAKIVDKEEGKAVQKMLPKDSNMSISLPAIGVVLLSFAVLLGVRMRRGLQQASAFAGSDGHESDISIALALAAAGNILELQTQESTVRGQVGWSQQSSKNSRPLTLCCALETRTTIETALETRTTARESGKVSKLHDFRNPWLDLHRSARQQLVQRFQEFLGQPEPSLLFFRGGEDAIRHDTDHEDIFRQESTFHYLFGVREPGCLAAIDLLSSSTILFVPRLPEEYAIWMGKIESPCEIRERYGVDEVFYTDEVASVVASRSPKRIFVQLGKNADSGSETVPASFESMREKYVVDDEVLHDVLYECRSCKGPEEVALLRLVNSISSDAHIEMMQATRPGLMEYQLESTFAHSCYYNGGCRLLSYTPIAGSGPNSAVLHYGHAGAPNDRELEDGDIVLCDMGAELYCYASDITNSFPANGRFSADQRLIFETVSAMQKAVLEAMGPGVFWPDMQELAYMVMCQRLAGAGLLCGDAENVDAEMAAAVGGVLMPHGLGHLMGIDTHDVGGKPPGTLRDTRAGFSALRLTRKLEIGMVLTVEPGIYFIAHCLQRAKETPEISRFFVWDEIARFEEFGGVRLEDNVMVTQEGIENFTVAPRTVEEVEAVMRGDISNSVGLEAWRHDRR